MEQKIDLLERRTRLLGLLCGISLLSAAAVLAMQLWPGRSPQGVVRARAFAVVDASGSTLATLGDEPTGPILRMHSPNAGADLVAGTYGPNVGLFLVDDKGKPRAMLSAGKGGESPSLTFSDSGGRTRLSLGTQPDADEGAPILVMFDGQGRARLYSRVKNEPVIIVRDEDGKAAWGYRQPDLP